MTFTEDSTKFYFTASFSYVIFSQGGEVFSRRSNYFNQVLRCKSSFSYSTKTLGGEVFSGSTQSIGTTF